MGQEPPHFKMDVLNCFCSPNVHVLDGRNCPDFSLPVSLFYLDRTGTPHLKVDMMNCFHFPPMFYRLDIATRVDWV